MRLTEPCQTLHDKVREAETVMKTSYADIVKKFDSQLKTMADTNQATNQPTGATATASAPDANLKELQDRQDRSKNLVVYSVPESQSKDRDNRKTHDKVHFQTICQEGLGGCRRVRHCTVGREERRQEQTTTC